MTSSSESIATNSFVFLFAKDINFSPFLIMKYVLAHK